MVFETELIRQLKIDVDYILMLVKKYHDSNREDAEILVTIRRAVEASPELRSKKDLVMAFIESLNRTDDVTEAWARYIGERREKELADLVTGEQLREKETRRFLEHAFREGEIRTTGTEIDGILPPMSRFGSGNREEKKSRVIDKLKAFLERFLGLGGPLFSAAKSYAAPAEESMDRVAEEKEI